MVPNAFKLFGFQIFVSLSVPEEGYSTLNLIFRFLFPLSKVWKAK